MSPSNPKGYMKRYYHANSEKFNNPKEKAKRAKRNKARRMMTKKLGKSAIAGKDIDHIKPLKAGGANTLPNLRPLRASINRGR